MKTNRTCSICNISMAELYCGQCGQKNTGKKATTFSLIGDFIGNFFSTEKSGITTIWQLIKNPAKVVDNYYLGNRNYYSSPGKLLLFAIAILAIHVSFIDPDILGITLEIEGFSSHYFFWLLLLPIFLIISFLTFFIKRYNFSRHVISVIYLSSMWGVILTIISDILAQFTTLFDDNANIFLFYFLLVFIWDTRSFTKGDKFGRQLLFLLIQIILFTAIAYGFILLGEELSK